MTGNPPKLPKLAKPARPLLAPAQVRALQALTNYINARKRSPTIMELALYLGVSRSPAYNALLALESKGYARRNKETRRFEVVP